MRGMDGEGDMKAGGAPVLCVSVDVQGRRWCF